MQFDSICQQLFSTLFLQTDTCFTCFLLLKYRSSIPFKHKVVSSNLQRPRQYCQIVNIGLTLDTIDGQRSNKKAQLSPTNPRDVKACQKLLQFNVLTTLSLTIILAYLHSCSCCCVRNLRNPAKFTENLSLWSSRSSKVIDLGAIESPCTTSY